jgi:DNA primase
VSTQDWARSYKSKRVEANTIPIEPIVSFFGGEVRGGTGEIRVKCLMHNDSHRSASMNVDTNLYYCQTCGKGGNAVNIVCILENLEFIDGLKRAVEIAAGSGAAIRTGNKSRGARRASRTWDI